MLVAKNAEDKYNEGYSQNASCFKPLPKDDILQSYILKKDIQNNVDNAGDPTDGIGYSMFVFDIRYHENFSSAQPLKKGFKFDRNVPAGVNAHASILTIKQPSIINDGQTHFDLTLIQIKTINTPKKTNKNTSVRTNKGTHLQKQN